MGFKGMSAKNVNEWLDKSHPIDYDDQQAAGSSSSQTQRDKVGELVAEEQWVHMSGYVE